MALFSWASWLSGIEFIKINKNSMLCGSHILAHSTSKEKVALLAAHVGAAIDG